MDMQMHVQYKRNKFEIMSEEQILGIQWLMAIVCDANIVKT